MDFCAQPAATVAERLVLLFLGAPALCWCARTMVLSIMAYSLSASLAKCSNTRSHTPAFAQRLKPGACFSNHQSAPAGHAREFRHGSDRQPLRQIGGCLERLRRHDRFSLAASP